ncbi:MAG: DUF2802 domain-containing protein [Gammaproteobacteria bacterium]|nr:DUF2802 domain-containing protein [Gammaproteobacteria bacterium]MDJ0890330.1 DUF2802 domain-containing protein [Gammaproteobacteria bacterium]
MDIFSEHTLYLGGGSLLLLALAALALVLVHTRRLKRRMAQQDAFLRSLERDMQAVCRGAKGMGDTVVKLERKLRQLAERQDTLDLREPNSLIYNHAITLAHRGATIEDLVRSCGLARNEAKLVHLLHRRGGHRRTERAR